MTLREAKKLLKEKSLEYLLGRDDSINQQCFEKPRKTRTRLTLDDVAAQNGATKTQDRWIKYYNKEKRIREGKLFASMAEIYQVFKQIVDAPEEHEALLASLRRDFDEIFLLSSTRIRYNAHDGNAQIMHNYGSKMQKEPIELEIPVLRPGKLTELNDKGIEFLQALLDTDENKEEIMGVLSRISNRPNDKLRVWTPPFDSFSYYTRSERSERAVTLDYYIGNFRVLADGLPDDYDGRSRAVEMFSSLFSAPR